MPPRTGETLVLGLAALLLLAGCHSKGAPPAAPLPSIAIAGPAGIEAADRGTEWLMANKGALPQTQALTSYRKIYKVTSDDTLAGRLLQTIGDIEGTLPPAEIRIDMHDSQLHRWHNLRPVLMHLLRRKCAGEPLLSDSAEVEGLIDLNWQKMFPGRMELGKKLVAAYLLDELGIGEEFLYESVIQEIRSHSDLLDNTGSQYYTTYLYALTHVVMTKSGYYERYVDPSECEFEIGAFRQALKSFASAAKVTDTELDLAAEILICVKLLRLTPDEHMRAAARRLISNQNEDGSWGHGGPVDAAKAHNTSVAVLALIEFAPEFRPGHVFCETSTY
jgi:hypothetical protein